MKEQIYEVLYELFAESMISYVDNFDDMYCGYEFNPNDPRVLIRFKWSLNQREGSAEHIKIEIFRINTYDMTCDYKVIYSGAPVVNNKEEIDFGFYRTILKHWRKFIANANTNR